LGSVSAEVSSSEDLLEDLPVDLPSPVWPLPDVVVEEAALPLPAGLLPLALAFVCWPGAVVLLLLSELEFELLCVVGELLDEVELLVWDCDCVLVGAWGAGAGCGAWDWVLLESDEELLSISAEKLLAPVEAEEADWIDFDNALSCALAVVSNVTLTTASLSR
jgi:hypothetical protein